MITGALQDRLLSEDDKILVAEVFDSEGKLRLYHPAVQQAIFDAVRTPVLAEIKKSRAEAEKNRKG